MKEKICDNLLKASAIVAAILSSSSIASLTTCIIFGLTLAETESLGLKKLTSLYKN